MLWTTRPIFLIVCLTTSLPVFHSFYKSAFQNEGIAIVATALSITALSLVVMFAVLGRYFSPSGRLVLAMDAWIDRCSIEIVEWLDGLTPIAGQNVLVAAAGASLFIELVLIRWEAGIFPVFALYKNFTLLSCFCGLGIGYAIAKERRLLISMSLPMILILFITFTFLRYGAGDIVHSLLRIIPVREEGSVLFKVNANTSSGIFFLLSVPIYLLLCATFALNTLVLLPIGQFCGHLMQRMEPLKSYGWNLLGSIAGAGLLFLLSWAWAGPAIWFGIAVTILVLFQFSSPSARGVAFGSAIVCMLTAAWPVTPLIQTIYSPYQMIEKSTQSNGLMNILASGSYFQKIYDLSLANANREKDPALRKIVGYYELPFKTARSLRNVAIVGAGSGNDVAAALRNNAGHVDAVEIDPAIRDLGWENHPEKPYQDRRVHSIINDARNFFRTTDTTYDVIVYGVLDSHIVVSQGANMRVDSFVYTTEGLQDAFGHLKQGGLMSVSFALSDMLMGEKIYRILKSFPGGGPPVAILTGYDANNTTTFMVRKNAAISLPEEFLHGHQLADVTNRDAATSAKSLDVPSDDWPFFYLERKMYPATYMVLLGIVLGMSLLLVRATIPLQIWRSSYLPFFFLGGGFMLVETKTITELGLLFGNTWQVVGITIMSVLVIAYFANMLASRLNDRTAATCFLGVFALLFAGYAIAIHGGLGTSSGLGKFVLVAVMCGPVGFSGLVFSTLLKKVDDVGSAMSYNILGAMLGGMLEYNSMRFGFSALYLIAMGLYALAWLTMPDVRVLLRLHTASSRSKAFALEVRKVKSESSS
jgi:spermidine synthase